MNEKKFNKIFGTTLMVLMIAVIVCITIIKAGREDAKLPLLLIASFGTLMGFTSAILSANGYIWTFLFGILDVAACSVVTADNGAWGDFGLHVFYLLPMQFVGIWQWRKRGAQGARSEVQARRLSPRQRLWVSAAVAAGLAVSYGVLLLIKLKTVAPEELNRPQVFFDAAVFALNIAGQILMSLAFMEQWVLWNLVNVFSILLWGSTMLSSPDSGYTVVMFIKYCFYLVNSVNGLRIWLKLSEK